MALAMKINTHVVSVKVDYHAIVCTYNAMAEALLFVYAIMKLAVTNLTERKLLVIKQSITESPK